MSKKGLVKIFLVGLTAAILFVLLLLAGLLLPSVQKIILVSALSGPEREVSVSQVRIRPGSVLVRELAITDPGRQFRAARLEAGFDLFPLLFRRTLDIISINLVDLEIKLAEPAEEVAFWDVFSGVLIDLPLDFRLASLQANGLFQAAATGTVGFSLSAHDLDSRRDDGRIAASLSLDQPRIPEFAGWSAELVALPSFRAEGGWHGLRAELSLGHNQLIASTDLLLAEIEIEKTGFGELYRFSLDSVEPGQKTILEFDGAWSRTVGEVAGSISFKLEQDLDWLVPIPDGLPDFSLSGQAEFKAGPHVEPELDSEISFWLSGVSSQPWVPQAIDRLPIDFTSLTAQFAVSIRNGRLEISTDEPWSLAGLQVLGQAGQVVSVSELQAWLNGAVTMDDFDLQLALAATTGEYGNWSITWRSVADLPLAQIDSRINLELESMAQHAWFEKMELLGSIETQHPNSDLVPNSARLEAVLQPVFREAQPYLPVELGMVGEIERAVEGGANYELQIALSETMSKSVEENLKSIGLRGEFDAAWSWTKGEIELNMPAWLTEYMVAEYGLPEINHASARAEYTAVMSPFEVGLEAVSELVVDGRHLNFPGSHRFRLTADTAWHWQENLSLNQGRLELSVPGRDGRLLSANLRQPLVYHGQPGWFEILPEGELVQLEPGELVLADWLPGLLGGVSGGRLRGGLVLLKQADLLTLVPVDTMVELAGIGFSQLPETETAPLDLSFRPRLEMKRSKLEFALADLLLSARNADLLNLSLSGEMEFVEGLPGPLGETTGTISANGDLAAVYELFGPNLLPGLQAGSFSLDTEFSMASGPWALVWNGSIALPQLQSAGQVHPFMVNFKGGGRITPELAESRVAAEIESRGTRQQLDLAASIELDRVGPLPVLKVNGTSDFLDLTSLQQLATIFSPGQPEVAPEADNLESLLPFELEAGLKISQIRMFNGFSVFDLDLSMHGNQQLIELSELRGRFFEEGTFSLQARLDKVDEIMTLRANGSGRDFTIERLLRQTQGVERPDIEGMVAISLQAMSTGSQFSELLTGPEARLGIELNNGRLRLKVPDRRLERIRRLTGMQEGAIGAVIARLAGAPPGLQALAESLDLLTDLPYDSIQADLSLTDEAILEIASMEVLGPYIYADGRGRIRQVDFSNMAEASLEVELELGTRGRLQHEFTVLRLLDDEVNPQGYRMLRQRPIPVTGKLGDPGLQALWDLLIQAAAGAISPASPPATEERRPDPADVIIDGVRDLFGF